MDQFLHSVCDPIGSRPDGGDECGSEQRGSDERGQATAEYILVMLGAVTIAVLFIGWAASGGGGGHIGQLLDRVFQRINDLIT